MKDDVTNRQPTPRYAHTARMEDDSTRRRIGREITTARTYADKTRKEIAAAIDIGDQQLGRYERGEVKKPLGVLKLVQIARICGIPQAWLDGGFLAPASEPVTRVADALRAEAQRSGAHSRPSAEDPPGAGEPGAGS